jgi:hypothetical protein
VGEEQTEKTSDAQYTAYVDFTPDDTVRLDMTVSVYTQGDSAQERADDVEGGADESDDLSTQSDHD